MPQIKDEKEILKKTHADLRKAILYDSFSKQSSFSRFLYTHIPPFNTAQKKADEVDCNKSVIAALLFNQQKLPEGIEPISFEFEEFPACKRIAK